MAFHFNAWDEPVRKIDYFFLSQLNSLLISRAKLGRVETVVSEITIIEPMTFKVNVSRNLSTAWFHGIPDIEVTGVFDSIFVSWTWCSLMLTFLLFCSFFFLFPFFFFFLTFCLLLKCFLVIADMNRLCVSRSRLLLPSKFVDNSQKILSWSCPFVALFFLLLLHYFLLLFYYIHMVGIGCKIFKQI